MADTAQEVECLCAFDLTSMLHDLKPLLLQAMALSKQAAAASQQPALLGQDGHGQYQPALLGQDGHGQYQGQGQGQGPGIGRRLEGLPSSKADIATMLADEQSAVGGMFDSQSAMLGSIAAMYIVKKATSPGGMCPSICTAGSGGAPPASNCDVPLHGKGGGGEGSPAPPSDKAGKGGKGEALSSSLLSIEAKKAEYSKSQALGTSACPGGGGGGGDATAAAVIFALLFVASSTAAFYFYRKAELGGRAKTAQAAISNAQAGSEATIWRIDPLSPAQGADNLRPPQQIRSVSCYPPSVRREIHSLELRVCVRWHSARVQRLDQGCADAATTADGAASGCAAGHDAAWSATGPATHDAAADGRAATRAGADGPASWWAASAAHDAAASADAAADAAAAAADAAASAADGATATADGGADGPATAAADGCSDGTASADGWSAHGRWAAERSAA
eukprot:scaffold122866_cov66-Phaeocystis_antarctica.AAC.1